MGDCLCMATARIMKVECMPYHDVNQVGFVAEFARGTHRYSVVGDADDAIHPERVDTLGHPDEEVDDLPARETVRETNRRRRTQIRQ